MTAGTFLARSGGLLAALAILIGIAIQYPLQTTFPMGGDAPQYIISTRALLHSWQNPAELQHLNQWYPVANILFLPFAALPMSWAERYIWWATVGQVAVGVALGFLVYRLAGFWAGVTSLAFWGITPIVGTSHYEDGTIAQLWSYVWFALCLERWHSLRPITALILLGVTLLCHPVTGLALLLIMIIGSWPLLLQWSRLHFAERRTAVVITVGILLYGVLAYFVLQQRQDVFGIVQASIVSSSTPVEVWRSALAPLVLLVPIGVLFLFDRWRTRPVTLILLVAFITVTTLLSSNNLLGLSVWIRRLAPLFIILVTILASVAWPALIRRAFSTWWLRTIAVIPFFAVLIMTVWPTSKTVYAFHESPGRYARLHPDELEAIQWLGAHTTKDSVIISTTLNRHSEWLPVFTEAQWQPAGDISSHLENQGLTRHPAADQTYIIFFLKREQPSANLETDPWRYPIVFVNSGAMIFKANFLSSQ